MKKIVNTLALLGFGVLSFVGITGTSDAALSQGIQNVKENSPLYLDKAISLQQISKQSILLAEHYSHQSHYSHESHRSHYSSRY